MNTMTLVQIITSFVVGGSFITLLTFIAERSDNKTAGIILTLPSTIVLGFFFLGTITSARQVADAVPAALIPLGIVILSSAVYIYCSIFFEKLFRSKRRQIIATFILSSLIWFVLVSPFAIWKPRNLTAGVIGFFVLIGATYLLLNRDASLEKLVKHTYSNNQIVFRALFTGSIIAIVVMLGKFLGAFWGAIFTMYPAASFASLMIFHSKYDAKLLFHFMKKAPLGSLSLFIYSISVMILFPKTGIVAGTLISFIISLICSTILARQPIIRLQK